MRHVSIRTLMASIVVSAVGLAALRNADDLWAGIMLPLTLAAVGVAVLGGAFSRGKERAWLVGCALFGGGYLAAALSPIQLRLGTTHLLEYVHARAVSFSLTDFEISRADRTSILVRAVSTDGTVSTRTVPNSVYNPAGQDILLATMESPNRWRSALPGATNHDAFLLVGHCLFTLLAGLVGGTVAVWFWRRRERAEAA
jgi:hypothetical protein